MVKVTNGERMAKIEERLKNTSEQLKNHTEEQREDFDKVFKKIDELQEHMNKSFAGKWVEKISIGIIIVIVGALITALLQAI